MLLVYSFSRFPLWDTESVVEIQDSFSAVLTFRHLLNAEGHSGG